MTQIWPTAKRVLFGVCLASSLILGSATDAAAGSRRHVVKKGDTLSRIAASYKTRVRVLKRLNRLKSDRIVIGQKLRLPKGAKLRLKAPRKPRVKTVTHRVRPGEVLGQIAKKYSTSVKEIMRRNRLKNRNSIRVGQRLKIRTRQPVLELCTRQYRVAAGDSISRIKKRFNVTKMEILYHNPKIKNLNRIRIGQKLRIVKECPAATSPSQSVGSTNAGRLVNGVQLPCGKQYPWYCRTPSRSWGTKETVQGIMDAVDEVNARFGGTHRVAIEHISAKHGGHLRPHISHQSGRDVDIGFYFPGQPKHGPKRFLDATKHRLDFPRTWALLRALLAPKKGSRVKHIFCDYKVQRAIYRWARRKGKSKKVLGEMFQYPNGKRKLTGRIRHVKGHKGHLHVRFGCPRDDKDCKR